MAKKFGISVNDLLGLFAFLTLHGADTELKIEGERVYGFCIADETFNELSKRFNQNESVPILSFLKIQREIRSKMLALKAGGAK